MVEVGTVIMMLFLGIIYASVALFVATLTFMFGVGAVHTWIPAVPTIGFAESCVIVTAMFVLSLLGTFGVKVTFKV